MTDTTATPQPIWDVMKALAPSMGQVLVIVATFATGIGTTIMTQRYLAPVRIAAERVSPLAERPVMTMSATDVDHIVQSHCSQVQATLAEILGRLPAKRK